MSLRLSRRKRASLLLALLLGPLLLGPLLLLDGAAAAESVPSADGAKAVRLPLRSGDGGAPNVLLLTIDTLRMDHLGAYGYRLATSPAIDGLAREGVVFTNAITPVPMTAPALASLLTGQHVQVHRVHANVGTFPENVGSIAQAFASAGYETAAFYGNEAVEEFGRGFRVFEEFPRKRVPGGLEMADDLGVQRGIEWLSGAKEPWFLWLHLIDPHGPYDSSPAERSAAFTYPDDPALLKELETSPKNWVFGAIPKYQGLPGGQRVVDYLRRYDGEIVGTDLQIAKLRAWLEAKGEIDHTLIVLTADHGESLTENNYYFQHGKVLNEASLRVPLLLRHGSLPAGIRVDEPVSLIDLYPTIARLAGLPAPAGVEGRDVSETIAGAELGDRLRITYTVTPDLKVGVLRGPWRLHGRPQKKKGGVRIDRFPRLHLADTSRYPEVPASVEENRDTVDALARELVDASRRLRSVEAPKIELTEQQEKRLRALGYVD